MTRAPKMTAPEQQWSRPSEVPLCVCETGGWRRNPTSDGGGEARTTLGNSSPYFADS